MIDVIEAHECANVFRLLAGDEYDCLVDDIANNGLLNPICLYEGKILDGRNRHRACLAAGVDPIFVNYEGSDPIQFVISANEMRRHDNESQRAMAAARLANLKLGDNQHTKEGASIEAGTSQTEAAETMGVSRRAVQTATKVQATAAPEVLAAIDGGFIAVSDAASIIEMPLEDQSAIV